MEKIKNLLKPGKSEDDATLYGTGQQSGAHSGGLTGEGSHLGGATNTSQSTNPISSNNQHTSGTGNSGLGGAAGQPTQLGAHGGQGSHFPSAGHTSDLPIHSSGVTTTTTTSTHTGQSHIPRDTALASTGTTAAGHAEHGHQGHQSGLGSATTGSGLGHNTGTSSGTTSGPHTSDIANRADPRVDSDNSRNAGLGSATTGSGLGHNQNSGIPSNTTSGPHTSNLANRADPRVDSDNSRNAGLGNAQVGATSGLSGLAGGSTASHSHSGNTHATGTHVPGSSNLGQTTQTGANPNYSQGSSDHHLGRDAGIVGGAGVLGAGAHSHHERGHEHAPATSGPHNTYAANMLDPSVNTRGSGYEDAHQHTASGGGAEEADAHHGGRPTESAAALGRNTGHQYGTNAGIGAASSTGPAPHTAGPHQKDLANVVDPRVNPNNAAGVGAQAQTGSHTNTDASGHHYGRDAAIGAGGVGAAGLVAGQHHHNQTGSGIGQSNTSNIHQSSTGASGMSGPAPHTAGPHNSDLLNKADPRVEANPTASQGYSQSQSGLGPHAGHDSIPHDKDYNYGRDAAITGGATSAFVGTHDHAGTSNPSHLGQHGAATDPHSTSSTQRSNDHHLGRDAAVVGGAAGVGGAAYGADKHHEKELEKARHEAEKEHKHDLKEAEKHHKIEEKRAEKHAEKDHKHAEKDEKKKHGGFLSFLHRDKSKKYSAEEEADFERQEREHNASQSHTGRNAALGGAAVAGTGAGVYAADRHHDADTNKSLPTAPGNHGVGTGAGTQNALAGNTSHTGHDSITHGTQNALAGNTSHTGHDSATHGTPLPLKPAGKDIGDILHGTDRNRGVVGSSGFPDQPGFGDGAHPHAHSEATTDQQGRPVGAAATGAGIGSQQAGREFPLGHSKHDSGYTDKNSPIHATSQHHNTGRDATALGGAGLVGENEHRKHDNTTGQHSSLTGTHGSSGLTGNQTTSGYPTGNETSGLGSSTGQYDNGSSGLTGSHTSDLSGRNKLHKDPPAGHPAAQGYDNSGSHVPAGGAERERIVEQGKDHLGHNTGVANAQQPNSSTNY
ncbi:hypothetical protein VTL71DRAFT_447 [Oculimacula yallundae]|uniref:Dehydrin n=1 Tax=Oculimacula yallundae TaxID=86028 RepID=A0ABR4D048_9HELO